MTDALGKRDLSFARRSLSFPRLGFSFVWNDASFQRRKRRNHTRAHHATRAATGNGGVSVGGESAYIPAVSSLAASHH